MIDPDEPGSGRGANRDVGSSERGQTAQKNAGQPAEPAAGAEEVRDIDRDGQRGLPAHRAGVASHRLANANGHGPTKDSAT